MKGDYPSTGSRAKTIDGAQRLCRFSRSTLYILPVFLLFHHPAEHPSREPMQDADLRALTAKLELLIQRSDHLQAQNRQLTASAKAWREERSQLIEKNELARAKVESMIMRLKALEHDS
jgi:cell division protein ZapB